MLSRLRKRSALEHLVILTGVSMLVLMGWSGSIVGAVSHSTELSTEDEKSGSKEYTIKAAFLFNFLKYTTWPEGTFERKDDPIVLGIVGEDPFGTLIEKALAKKKVGDREVLIRRFDDVTRVNGVQTLFLGAMPDKERVKLYALLALQPILSVGDSRGMAGADKCVASFFLHESRIRFEVSIKAIKRTRIALSSQLLKLADIVDKD